jgi:GxxExxY protein
LHTLRTPSEFDALTYKVIGCAMEVHNELGPRLKEATYHHALHLAMTKAGLTCEEEVPVEIRLDEMDVGLLYLDHLVERVLIVEDKALPHELTGEEKGQVVSYLAASSLPIGLLFNFGRARLEYKRIFPPSNRIEWAKRVGRYLWTPRRAL